MQDKVTYEFAVIRVVPKVEREEFLNVGVLLFSKPRKYLGIKYKIDDQRIRAFSDEVDLEALHQYLEAWQMVCEGNAKGGPIGQLDLAYRFRWLTAARSTIVQCSPVHPGLCTKPEEMLPTLFEFFVL